MPRIQTGRRGRRVRVAAGLATATLVCGTLLTWPGGPEAGSAGQESSAAAGDAPSVNSAPEGETSTDAVVLSEARTLFNIEMEKGDFRLLRRRIHAAIGSSLQRVVVSGETATAESRLVEDVDR